MEEYGSSKAIQPVVRRDESFKDTPKHEYSPKKKHDEEEEKEEKRDEEEPRKGPPPLDREIKLDIFV